jgi:hypothetical protein
MCESPCWQWVTGCRSYSSSSRRDHCACRQADVQPAAALTSSKVSIPRPDLAPGPAAWAGAADAEETPSCKLLLGRAFLAGGPSMGADVVCEITKVPDHHPIAANKMCTPRLFATQITAVMHFSQAVPCIDKACRS